MKKKTLIFLLACMLGNFTSFKAFSQDTTTAGQDIKNAAKKTGKAVKKGAVKAADKTAQVAANGKAAVVDKIYEGKMGPGNHRVYIDKHSKYYWIDEKGRKHYITEDEIKDKP